MEIPHYILTPLAFLAGWGAADMLRRLLPVLVSIEKKLNKTL